MRYLPLTALLGFFLASADELPATTSVKTFNYDRCLQMNTVSIPVREAIELCKRS